MTDKEILESEAKELLEMRKVKDCKKTYRYPEKRGKISVPLQSEDKKEKFFLDINRNGISLEKQTYQNRARKVIILARLDFGAPHTNPDGKKVGSPHIHLYKEGYDDKWAYELPKEFTNQDDFLKTLNGFLTFCNIEKNIIERDFLNEGLLC